MKVELTEEERDKAIEEFKATHGVTKVKQWVRGKKSVNTWKALKDIDYSHEHNPRSAPNTIKYK